MRNKVLLLRKWEIAVHALIIEDESMIAMTIEDILRDVGFTTFDVACSPAVAVQAAAQRCPDLITSDVQLKPGCGIGAVIQICEEAAIPVIFITGNVADVTRRLPSCRSLSKPFSTEQLSSAVAAALNQDPRVSVANGYDEPPTRNVNVKIDFEAFEISDPTGVGRAERTSY